MTLALSLSLDGSAAAAPSVRGELGVDVTESAVRASASTDPALTADDDGHSGTVGVDFRLRAALDSDVTLAARLRLGSAGVLRGRNELFLAGGLGYRFRGRIGELELAGEGGLHRFSSLVGGWLIDTRADPAVTLPFAGARLAANLPPRTTATLGLAALAGLDLGRRTVHDEWSVFTCSESADFRVGGWFAGLEVSLLLGGVEHEAAKR